MGVVVGMIYLCRYQMYTFSFFVVYFFRLKLIYIYIIINVAEKLVLLDTSEPVFLVYSGRHAYICIPIILNRRYVGRYSRSMIDTAPVARRSL